MIVEEIYNVLDLGYGTGSSTIAWEEAGHNVVGVDWVTDATIIGDWTDPETWKRIRQHGPYHFIWFSPDCSIFSMANMRWGPNIRDGVPISERAIREVRGIEYVLENIAQLRPKLGWIMENPRALMRIMDFTRKLHRATVTYCQYGDSSRQKPTDLFGQLPESFRPRECRAGSPCHVRAPRGSQSGTQGMSREDAGEIPYGLSLEIYLSAIESDGMSIPTLEDFCE